MSEFFVHARLMSGVIIVLKVSDAVDFEAARKAVSDEYACRCVLTLVPRGAIAEMPAEAA